MRALGFRLTGIVKQVRRVSPWLLSMKLINLKGGKVYLRGKVPGYDTIG